MKNHQFVTLILFFTIPLFISGQIYTPGTPQNSGTQNVGIDILTPGAKLDMIHPNDFDVSPNGIRHYFPGLRITSKIPGTGNPIEVHRAIDWSKLPASFNIPFFDANFAKPIFVLRDQGELSLGTGRQEGYFTIHNGIFGGNIDEQNDLLVLTYESPNGINWAYNRFGNHNGSAYWAYNARLKYKAQANKSEWDIDIGSNGGTASKIMHAWNGIYFQRYVHSFNQQGASTHLWLPFEDGWKTSMYIGSRGNVKIGEESITSGPHTNYKLSVDGKIVAREIFVTDGPEWGDFVFHKSYDLMPLNELELFIKKNNHLPDIPSAKTIEENGIDVNDIITKQMIKIEELTLHLIEMNKKIELLEKELKNKSLTQNNNQ